MLCFWAAACCSSAEGEVTRPEGVEVPCGLLVGDRDGISPPISKSPLDADLVGVLVRDALAEVGAPAATGIPVGIACCGMPIPGRLNPPMLYTGTGTYVNAIAGCISWPGALPGLCIMFPGGIIIGEVRLWGLLPPTKR